MRELFWSVFALSFAVVASPGPVNLATVRHGVERGYWPALAVQVDALAAELIWGAAVLVGVGPLVQRLGLQPALTGAGAGLLLWTVWQALRDAWAAPSAARGGDGTRHGALAGALYASGNSVYATFWIGVAGILAAGGAVGSRSIQVAVIGAADTLGALSWGIVLAALVTWGRRVVQPRFWR